MPEKRPSTSTSSRSVTKSGVAVRSAAKPAKSTQVAGRSSAPSRVKAPAKALAKATAKPTAAGGQTKAAKSPKVNDKATAFGGKATIAKGSKAAANPRRVSGAGGTGASAKVVAAARPVDASKRKSIKPKDSQQEPGQQLALALVAAGFDKKALHAEVIDVRGKVDYTDYVVVMSGRSDRQVQAIARGIEDIMRREHGVRCLAVEGLPHATWVLMDYADVIVHIFHEDMRGYYDLESLWIDAARVRVAQPQA